MPYQDEKTVATPQKRTCPQCQLELESSVTVCPQDGTPLIAVLKPGVCLGDNYQLLATIGSGGMGIIYKAKQLTLNKTVAIKMLHSHLSSPEALQRFQREGKAASNLSHRNIIVIHDLGVTDSGDAYLVMDYCEGKTLAEVLEQNGPLSIDAFFDIFLQITDALAHAHQKGVLHRDIKPGNIMLIPRAGGGDEVKILDFGIAKIIETDLLESQHLTKTGEAIGSPLYMSPEQSMGKKIDHRCDLYSLGCVMYEALVGVTPFEGASMFETMMKHMNEPPLPLKEVSLGKEFPPQVEAIVIRLLAKAAEDRYQSMEDLRQDLLSVQSNLGNKTETSSQEGKPKQVNKPSPAALTLPRLNPLSLVLLIVVLALFIFIICHWSKFTSGGAEKAANRTSPGLFSDVEKLRHMLEVQPKIVKCNDNGEALRLKDEDLSAFRQAKDVQEVDLQDVPITGPGIKYLQNLPNLTSLNLGGTKVTAATLEPELAGLKRLRTLTVPDKFSLLEMATIKRQLPKCLINPMLERSNELSRLADEDSKNHRFEDAIAKRTQLIQSMAYVKLEDPPAAAAEFSKQVGLALDNDTRLPEQNTSLPFYKAAIEQFPQFQFTAPAQIDQIAEVASRATDAGSGASMPALETAKRGYLGALTALNKLPQPVGETQDRELKWARRLLLISQRYRDMEKYRQCESAAKEAALVLEQIAPTSSDMGDALTLSAKAAYEQKHFAEAEKLCTRALSFLTRYETGNSHEQKDLVCLAWALNGMGKSLYGQQKYHEAQAYYARALQLPLDEKNKVDVASKIASHLAEDFEHENKPAQAKQYRALADSWRGLAKRSAAH